ncbi:hypothetical protein B0I37DRAFT_81846 [Chaetomium sp. MPI-CAGE-AT-0009]|nr:hypothetical protein B0I37DRAFT_81846 [Chaetomium sp. MPI-CAGE-AT-0009]
MGAVMAGTSRTIWTLLHLRGKAGRVRLSEVEGGAQSGILSGRHRTSSNGQDALRDNLKVKAADHRQLPARIGQTTAGLLFAASSEVAAHLNPGRTNYQARAGRYTASEVGNSPGELKLTHSSAGFQSVPYWGDRKDKLPMSRHAGAPFRRGLLSEVRYWNSSGLDIHTPRHPLALKLQCARQQPTPTPFSRAGLDPINSISKANTPALSES